MRLDNLARVGMSEGRSRQSTDLIKWPEVHSPSTRTIESSLVRYSKKKTLFISNFSLLLMLETWKFYLRAFAAAANTMNQNSKSNFAYHCVPFPLAKINISASRKQKQGNWDEEIEIMIWNAVSSDAFSNLICKR